MASIREQKLQSGKFDVSVELDERLIVAQFPQWAGLAVAPVAMDGWDNWTFRLGDEMKVRLPSAEGYVPQTEKEARWLPVLAPHLPLPIPVPLAVGEPGEGYPWPWSVYRWLPGDVVRRETVSDRVALARDVAGFLRALQAIDATGGPPAGTQSFFRGGDIKVYEAETRRCIEKLGDRIDGAGAAAVIDAAVAARIAGPPVWVHGDVGIGNMLAEGGRLSAVLDFGCCAIGDPACDLVLAWTFLEGESRAVFQREAPGDAATWARARGWALWKALLILAEGMSHITTETPAAEVAAAVIGEHRTLD
jgi:aminoglycoside phosphotransferase (APT) family kinase protein